MSQKKDDHQGKTKIVSDKEFDQEYQTNMLKTMFPGRTDAELVKINRNFLRDVEPFDLSRLMNEIKKVPETIQTGFKQLDDKIRIPNSAITIVTGNSKQGKSIFMMNMIFNMTQNYKGKHFLYYTYEEAKKDIELKLINLAGEKSFDYPGSENSEKKNVDPQFLSNLDIWNWKLKTTTEAELLQRASEDPSYKGLMNFLDISSRLHIIDSNYNVSDLIESMKLFNGPFIIGAVFVDFIQKIEPIKDNRNARRDEQLFIVSEHLRRFINKMSFPLILGVLYPTHGMVKYAQNESLLDDSGINLGGLEQDASLIIDLKQQKNKNEDIVVAKVLANRIGPKAEAHLKFNRLLLRIENQDE